MKTLEFSRALGWNRNTLQVDKFQIIFLEEDNQKPGTTSFWTHCYSSVSLIQKKYRQRNPMKSCFWTRIFNNISTENISRKSYWTTFHVFFNFRFAWLTKSWPARLSLKLQMVAFSPPRNQLLENVFIWAIRGLLSLVPILSAT